MKYMIGIDGGGTKTETRLIPMDKPPISGAAAEALWDAQIPYTEEFRIRFMDDYNAIVNG